MPCWADRSIHFSSVPYLGAPFLPRRHEYFETRRGDGHISSFFKTDTPIHGSPDQVRITHGNGGLDRGAK